MTQLLARPTGLRADAARNRSRLLEVARDHLAATGQLPLNAIAAEAGVGIGTAYRHFPDQRALIEALAIEGFDDMIADVRTTIAVDDPTEALHRMIVTVHEHLCADAPLAAMLTAGAFVCSDAAAAAGDLFADIAQLLDRAKAAGALRDDVTVDDLRRLLCGLQAATTAGPAALDAPARYAEVLIAGLRPR
ncbi:TetR/AcrR family transcriptional regulator [Microbacterium terrisoli]|jgi:AcrR family transcriptional regulator|uniref:TetR/AcrR family transcriptional regulator n=1 Tax=Microbacterium terrisoli TaxID=3242192 RepID=UPI00280378F4|nr:TetR/AcrR family transcriptional regulator [Microbacterium protaetiae]